MIGVILMVLVAFIVVFFIVRSMFRAGKFTAKAIYVATHPQRHSAKK